MQFIWKYIDDFVGKGLDGFVIAELLFYASANLVPMSLPLAILLSSIMTMGSMAEHYELVAMKASGLSLWRIMLPLILFIMMISAGAFYFNNTISPYANLKFKSLLWDVTHKKPTLEVKEGVFYNGIDGYSIRVAEKDKESNEMTDVLIYQHNRENPGNKRVIRASEGEMKKSGSNQNMVLYLQNGVSYDELFDKKSDNYPHIKSRFQEDYIMMDLSGFDLQRTDEDLWKSHMKMMSMGQLRLAIDSLNSQKTIRSGDFERYMDRSISLKDTTALVKDTTALLYDDLEISEQRQVVSVAMNMTRNAKNYMNRTAEEIKGRQEYINKHEIEWHRKLILSFACIILFFIGAPLGAIIKKGGLGLPVIFSVLFFLIFHITSISGEKMVNSGILTPAGGMWLSSMILLPIAIFLSYKASKDAALFDRDTYTRAIDRIKLLFQRKSRIAQ